MRKTMLIGLRSIKGDIVKFLVFEGADVNAKNKNDETPLHKAADGGSDSAIYKFLVSEGADENAKNKAGKTPSDIGNEAIRWRH